MKEIFKPEDFKGLDGFSLSDCEDVAKACNDKINQLIESWPVVYGNLRSGFETIGRPSWATQQARLAFIEEIPNEPCIHEPRKCTDVVGYSEDAIGRVCIDKRMLAEILSFQTDSKCIHCGVALKAEWKEKK